MSRIDKAAAGVMTLLKAWRVTPIGYTYDQAIIGKEIAKHISAAELAEHLTSCRYGLVEQVNNGDGTPYLTQEPSQREQAIASLTAAIDQFLNGGE